MSETEAKSNSGDGNSERPVLVAVDTSADSVAALLWACRHAERLGAPVVALHVVHDPAEAPGYYKRRLEADALRPIEEIAKTMLDEFLTDFKKSYPDLAAAKTMRPVLVRGLPASRILEAAEEVGARMIVMGSRGLTGLPHLLLGSKAERVVQLSPVPVTIVKSQEGRDRE